MILKGPCYARPKFSVWIKTVTTCSSQDQITSSNYTHVLAIGRKSTIHNEVNLIHNTKLKDLSRYCYTYFGAANI